MHANTYFEFSYGNTKQYDFLCIFERLDCIQLKYLILFVFLVLNIQKHIRKYKHMHPSFFLLINPYILQIFTQHCN
jgi:hypothetical protein